MVIARYSNVHFVRKTVVHTKPSQRFFADGQSDKAVNMNYALKYIQEDIGNLIELLNDFNTPSFVYPHMLKTTEMYNFSKEEIAQINTVKSLDEM